jgi:hypothetical protein
VSAIEKMLLFLYDRGGPYNIMWYSSIQVVVV